MIAQSCHDFLAMDVWPILDRIMHRKKGLMVELMNKAAVLGSLGLNVPEKYEGFEKDFGSRNACYRNAWCRAFICSGLCRTTGMVHSLFYITATRSKRKNTFLNWLPENGKVHIASQNSGQGRISTRAHTGEAF